MKETVWKKISFGAAVFTLAVMAALFSGNSAEAKSGPVANGTYMIVSAINSNYVMDVAGCSAADGANVQLYKKNGSNAQRFILTCQSDGYYTITNVGSAKLLDCAGGGRTNGTNVQQYRANSTAAQRWKLTSAGNGYYTLTCKSNGLLADVDGGRAANDRNIQMYSSNGTAAQKWKFVATSPIANGTYQIASSLNSKFVMDVDGGSTADFANIRLFSNNDTNAQKFTLTYQSDGYYTITNVNSGKLMDCDGSGTADTTNIHQYHSNKTPAQRWKIRLSVSGGYTLTCKCNGLLADVDGGKAANGTNIQMFRSNGTAAQRWKFIATAPTPKQTTPAAASLNFAAMKSKYPSNSYWNGSYRNIAWQCHGFALTLGEELTGTNPTGWKKVYNLNSLKRGDIIRCGRPHTIMVTAVSGNTITYVDCNWVGKNKVKWDQTIQRSQITSKFGSLDYVFVCPK